MQQGFGGIQVEHLPLKTPQLYFTCLPNNSGLSDDDTRFEGERSISGWLQEE
jgi:hypothetical protein